MREIGVVVYVAFTHEHWKTRSYAKHKVLDEYREVIHDDIDAIMEASRSFQEIDVEGVVGSISPIKEMIEDYIEICKEHAPNSDVTVRNLVEALITHMSRFLYLYALE